MATTLAAASCASLASASSSFVTSARISTADSSTWGQRSMAASGAASSGNRRIANEIVQAFCSGKAPKKNCHGRKWMSRYASVPWGQSQEFGGLRRSRPRWLQWRTRVKEDDFEIDDDGGFDAVDMAAVDADEEENFTDYEPEYDVPVGYESITKEADSFINTEGEVEETVVDWKINEDEFHKLNLLTCDFFIRKVPDPDDNVYDFREMYVTPPDTDVYSIPKVHCKLPRRPIRCYWSNHEYIHTIEPPVDEPRAPLAKTEYEVMKVFLMRHFNDRRAKDKNFLLDFEEIYVIDTLTKSFSKADVQLKVPGGKHRDRLAETLVVRDDGTTFCILPEGEEKTPDEVVRTLHWNRTRENMENYLRGFRDYEILANVERLVEPNIESSPIVSPKRSSPDQKSVILSNSTSVGACAEHGKLRQLKGLKRHGSD